MSVTRLEVIDETGRVLTRYPAKVELSYQDDGRTLKVFLSGDSSHETKAAQVKGLVEALTKLRRMGLLE